MTTRLVPLVVILLLTVTACGAAIRETSGSEDPVESSELAPINTPIPVEPDGGIGGAGPLPVEPDSGIGDGAPRLPDAEGSDATDGVGQDTNEGAPAFGVSSETDSLSVDPFGYCWSDGGVGLCADGLPTVGDNPLIGADQLVITYAPGSLTATANPTDGPTPEGSGQPDTGTSLSVNQDDTGMYTIDISGLADGTHAVTLFWNGDQGDASALLTLTVDRP